METRIPTEYFFCVQKNVLSNSSGGERNTKESQKNFNKEDWGIEAHPNSY